MEGRKIFDLEERTFEFAKNVVAFCKKLPRTVSNIEYFKQVVRSSGSVGANYIEANGALGKNDFRMRIRISRKEAKETVYWLRLIATTNPKGARDEASCLASEAIGLKKILSAILQKV
ncbi:MAG: four helix bundle protein [Patescibacteria group bacterium]